MAISELGRMMRLRECSSLAQYHPVMFELLYREETLLPEIEEKQ